MLRALAFDVGRVIVRVNVERALAALGASAGLSGDQVWSAIRTDPRMPDFQEGRMTPQEWHQHLVRRFGIKLSFAEFCTAWNSAIAPEPLLDESLFARLAAEYRLMLISNTDPIHVAHVENSFRFPRHFPIRIYSCQVGASKPDSAIYLRAIREARLPPADILYVDDAQEFIEAGRSLGMQTLLFQEAEQFLGELHRRGILRA